MADTGIGLADAIASLRAELNQAMTTAEGEEIRFLLGDIDLEFEVTVSRKGDGRLGIKFWVVSVEGGGGISKDSKHRIKLLLHPERQSGENLHVRSGQPRRPE